MPTPALRRSRRSSASKRSSTPTAKQWFNSFEWLGPAAFSISTVSVDVAPASSTEQRTAIGCCAAPCSAAFWVALNRIASSSVRSARTAGQPGGTLGAKRRSRSMPSAESNASGVKVSRLSFFWLQYSFFFSDLWSSAALHAWKPCTDPAQHARKRSSASERARARCAGSSESISSSFARTSMHDCAAFDATRFAAWLISCCERCSSSSLPAAVRASNA